MERLGAPAWTRRRFVAVSGVAAATGGAWQRVLAQPATPVADFELPEEVFWATYSGLAYDQAVAIGDALQEAVGFKLNIHPTLGDEFTGELLRRDAVDFYATAVGGSIVQRHRPRPTSRRSGLPVPIMPLPVEKVPGLRVRDFRVPVAVPFRAEILRISR